MDTPEMWPGLKFQAEIIGVFDRLHGVNYDVAMIQPVFIRGPREFNLFILAMPEHIPMPAGLAPPAFHFKIHVIPGAGAELPKSRGDIPDLAFVPGRPPGLKPVPWLGIKANEKA